MIDKQLRVLVGDRGLLGADATGIPRVAPHTDEECSLVLSVASSEGWRVRIEGSGTWMPTDAPADLALTTRHLAGVTDLNPADLVATVRAGTTWANLRATLLDQGAWVVTDPPGSGRSVGSIVATATSGPLRTGFGTLRDQLLGLTLATGNGEIIRVGGKVVKNVAGYDITKLAVGSFGAFGVITSVNLRLRAVPRVDTTMLAYGERDELLRAARSILEAGTTPAALEVVSPLATGQSRWAVVLRLLGSDAAVNADRLTIADAVAPITLKELDTSAAAQLWRTLLTQATAGETTLRLGALPTALETALDTLAHYVDEECDDWIMVSVAAGVVRWSGEAQPNRLRLLRGVCAQLEMPITIERAPWHVRSTIGHFGAYRENIGGIITSLRRSFDDRGILAVPLSDES
ncbi:MAG: hypothetical protein AMS18_17270 [Gemmatimonas sp. SG8_17]|nr:MAG: hypothetical protein AMS18_17270 [Gemmatimonas sp. SG8_17]